MSADTGIKYFALAFEDELVVDGDGFSDWSEKVKEKHNLIVAELEALADRLGGSTAAVTSDGRVEKE